MKTKFMMALLFPALALSACAGGRQMEQADEYLVGVEYFAGWWEGIESKWRGPDGKDWRADYPDRIPLNGQINDQQTMDKDIEAAAGHGVDFFSILWYPNAGAEFGVGKINRAIEYFVNSPNAGKMKFMIELTNHAPFHITVDEKWNDAARLFAPKMKHPSYLRVDGRPVFKIHGGGQFLNDLGGDVARANRVLADFRNTLKKEGVGDVIIAVGLSEYGTVKGSALEQLDIDCTMQYMDPSRRPQTEADYPYELLTETAKEDMLARVDDVRPHVPFVSCGWNPRPWGDPRARFEQPSREGWKDALEMIKEGLDNNPNLGFPRRDGSTRKAFTIYAWNENGEGGFLGPSAGTGYMKLEVVDELFGE